MISLFVMHVVYQEAIHVYHFVSMAKKYYMKLYFFGNEIGQGGW